MSDHDVPGFRRLLDRLTPLERSTLDARCRGVNALGIGTRDGVKREAVRNRMLRIYAKARENAEFDAVSGQILAEALCWRLGYEQALADIEAQMARKRA